MTTTKSSKPMALALMGRGVPQRLKLDPDLVAAANETERKLALILAEVTELQREAQRATRGKVPSLLIEEYDAVDAVTWDEFLQSPGVVTVCCERSGMAPVAVLDFVLAKCTPSNWSALFWMRAWYEQVDRNASADVTAIAEDLARLFASKQAEAASLKAKAAANARHGQVGGSRDKQGKIREAWASGKYSSRDLCAEKEAGKAGMSFSTARRALRNTPDPG